MKKAIRKVSQYASKVRNHQQLSERDKEFKRFKRARDEAREMLLPPLRRKKANFNLASRE